MNTIRTPSTRRGQATHRDRVAGAPSIWSRANNARVPLTDTGPRAGSPVAHVAVAEPSNHTVTHHTPPTGAFAAVRVLRYALIR
jgi:hypothetical protein